MDLGTKALRLEAVSQPCSLQQVLRGAGLARQLRGCYRMPQRIPVQHRRAVFAGCRLNVLMFQDNKHLSTV